MIASSTATRGRNVSENASWNDDTSATITSTSSSTTSSSGRPMLPAASDTPARRRRASRRSSTSRSSCRSYRSPRRSAPGRARRPRSISLRIGTPASRAATTATWLGPDERARHDEVGGAHELARCDRASGASTSVTPSGSSARDPLAVLRGRGRKVLDDRHRRALGAQPPRQRPTPSLRARAPARSSRLLEPVAGGSRRRRCPIASATQMPANIQNRTMTVNSDHPPTSK